MGFEHLNEPQYKKTIRAILAGPDVNSNRDMFTPEALKQMADMSRGTKVTYGIGGPTIGRIIDSQVIPEGYVMVCAAIHQAIKVDIDRDFLGYHVSVGPMECGECHRTGDNHAEVCEHLSSGMAVQIIKNVASMESVVLHQGETSADKNARILNENGK